MPVPIYLRIARDLREQIDKGNYAAGDRLPTEENLCESYSATRYPVRQALQTLAGEGLVEARRPAGWFVRNRLRLIYRPQEEFEPAPSAEMDRFLGRLTAEGRKPTQTIEVAIEQPPRTIAQRLGTGEQHVVLRRRTRSIDGEPYNTNDSYFPLALVEGSPIMLPVDIARGTRQVLAELGAEEVRAIDEIVSRMPTHIESQRLDLPTGSPVIEHICTAYDRSDRAVRCTLNVLAGDRHRITYERQRPGKPE